jgi:hypothetical protein
VADFCLVIDLLFLFMGPSRNSAFAENEKTESAITVTATMDLNVALIFLTFNFILKGGLFLASKDQGYDGFEKSGFPRGNLGVYPEVMKNL